EPAHEVEPAARRVGLDLELAIGGARGEAEPAVDAGAQVDPGGSVLGIVPGEGRELRGLSAHAPEDSIIGRRRRTGPARGARPAGAGSLPGDVGVEAVDEAVEDRAEHDAGDDEDREPAEQRV